MDRDPHLLYGIIKGTTKYQWNYEIFPNYIDMSAIKYIYVP